jgi:hypothetical protein
MGELGITKRTEMNREIKFRVWDGERMYSDADSGYQIAERLWDEGERSLMPMDMDGFMLDLSGCLSLADECGNVVGLGDGYILMQFTGLHDVGGREIYEGDVLSYGSGRYGFEVPIHFEQGAFWAGSVLLTALSDEHNMRVIGDIYRNPGLIAEPMPARPG